MELPVAAIDVVEVAPPYDHAEVTAFLANRVVLEALCGPVGIKAQCLTRGWRHSQAVSERFEDR
jgi:hypothetical protein